MKKRIIYISVVVLACSVLSYFVIPAVVEAYTLLQRYNARVAERNDYTKHTCAGYLADLSGFLG